MHKAIFLSYSSQDADTARRICGVLRAAGLEVWFDQSELRGGDAWDASIRKQIKECALFVPIISASTDARPEGYFRLEWKLAVDRSHLMADLHPFFVPVILGNTPEPSARVPEKFRERQWTRLTDDASITAFAERVGKLIGGSGFPGRNASNTAPNGDLANSVERAKRSVPTDQTSEARRHVAPAVSPPPPHEPERGDNSAAAPTPPAPNPSTPSSTAGARKGRAWTIAVALCALLVAAIVIGVAVDHQRKTRFVDEGLPRVAELSRAGKFMEAFLLAREIESAGAADKLTPALRNEYSRVVNVTSTPPGAKIELRTYDAKKSDGTWVMIGTAPLEKVTVPRGVMEWRATMPDGAVHQLVQAATPNMALAFAPKKEGADGADGGVVPVAAGTISVGGLIGLKVAQEVKLDAFAIDRLEVRNRDYARFVAAGGYVKDEYWQVPMMDGARAVPFSEAMSRFKDATGRPGPATWKLGSFAEGEGELPVRGVSWYEAAAYARFVGKELPTLYHWYHADSAGGTFLLVPTILPSANFSSKGPRTSAGSRTIGAFGAVDMAGNVREWVATRTNKGLAIAVGGSWQDVQYQYSYANPYSPWARVEDIGFRCMTRTDKARNEKAEAPAEETKLRGSADRKPVTDAEYAVYTRFFEKSRAPLDVRTEPGDSPASPYWTRTKVSYATGYGNERMNAYLYLPKNAKPPFQAVVFMHGSGILQINKPYDKVGETAEANWVAPEMLVRGGRALLVPIWKGSYERYADIEADRDFYRERSPQWVSEMRRSVDFLQTRNEIDKDRIGYYGLSLGALWGPMLLAMEPRISASVWLAGGLEGALDDGDYLTPEFDGATYAPRVKAAVLMINGREDIRFPYETSQVPLFKLLGSPPDKKAHKTYPGGHSTLGWFDDMTRDTHDWFDQQFGPVKPATPPASAK